MVFSAVYPMAFDEDFHLGIIKIYAHQWSPFLHGQPADADSFGALARDPSYLFHYLMSFPYRAIAAITSSEATQIIVLRLMNVAFFAWSLVLFRRVLLRATKSPVITNGSIGVFILIPIVPQLAAHINYDNLLMVLVAALCLLVYRLIDECNARKLRVQSLGQFVTLGMVASLVKYAFLPIFGAACIFVAGYVWKKVSWRKAATSLVADWRKLRPLQLGVVIGLVLLSSVLFVQRYGVNVVSYHTPIADCGQVLSYDECSNYGPWIRNYNYAAQKGEVDPNPAAYTYTWLHDLLFRLFFAVNGPASDYANYPPLPLPYITASVLFIGGVPLVLFYARRLFKDPFAVFAALSIVLYCGALWIEDYGQFVETGQPVAINGRYLLPVLFLAAILIGRAMQYFFARFSFRYIGTVTAAVVLLLFLHGGGLLTFILRSDASWDWQNSTVVHVNDAARRVLAPIIIEGSKYY